MDEQRHPWRDLEGTAWCALAPVRLMVNDPAWEQILGSVAALPGGIEVDVDPGALAQALEGIELAPPGDDRLLVPVRLRDRAWPPLAAVVPLGDLRKAWTRIDPGAGPRATGTPAACQHPGDDRMHLRVCECCWWRWWRMRAEGAGIQVTK
jgi:hypothetical protein